MTFPDNSTQQVATYQIKDKNEFVELIALSAQMRKKLPAQQKGKSLLYRGVGVEELRKMLE